MINNVYKKTSKLKFSIYNINIKLLLKTTQNRKVWNTCDGWLIGRKRWMAGSSQEIKLVAEHRRVEVHHVVGQLRTGINTPPAGKDQ